MRNNHLIINNLSVPLINYTLPTRTIQTNYIYGFLKHKATVGPHKVASVHVHVPVLPLSPFSATIQGSVKLKRKNIYLHSSQINIDPQINDTILEIKNDSDKIVTLNKNMKVITVNNYEEFSCDFSVSQDILPPLSEKDFNLSGLDSKIKNRLVKLLISHRSAFARSTVELSAATTEHHRIHLQLNYPIKCPIYKIPFNLRNEFRRQIADLEKEGIISKSKSQYNTPALFVKQKEKWRLVLDFRKLKEITFTQDFAIPTLDDILHEVSGANYFSALDMKSAFNQIPLHFRDRHKTAFSTPDGDKYEFNRLCFGLKNSPEAFQSIAQEDLEDLLHNGALDTPFEWTCETQAEFDDIKESILNPPVLALPDPDAELKITTDASSHGIGVVLEQKYPNPKIKGSLSSVADHLSRYINNIPIALPESKDLIEMQREDPVLGHIIQKIHQNDMSPQISSYFINGKGLLCHLSKRPSRSPRSTTTRKQVCIPHCLKAEILESIHSEYGGHL
ncbi:retrovirus-related Pol polyprotein from transposon opus [Trichonephila clavipes]|uniref:Retrovirus-related Pol polyprotein from transposon opus n=1 Tax=Trichonephila clavipes TaxID=2585209 RepID=A0A8X6V4I6_TRICX|nr:retrovirus-related Pol polyprotein from transposon opus [Trichonephila clavipes]